MIKVSLQQAAFFAYHGLYPEEQLLGNKFEINIDVLFETPDNLSKDEITDTVNYERLYAIAAAEMDQTRKLLETVVHAIVSKIRVEYPFAVQIIVELKKLNPPLKGSVGSSSVTIIDKRNKAE